LAWRGPPGSTAGPFSKTRWPSARMPIQCSFGQTYAFFLLVVLKGARAFSFFGGV
jgi:hypothetical protein